MATIIIPAHNEANSIFSCLHNLVESLDIDKYQVIVVCNGCTDETANIVKAFSNGVVCLETEIASKTHALNMGDNEARFYPRIYLDADVVINSDAVRAMCATLKNDWLATSVELKIDTSKSSWPVRAFYDIWLRTPYCKAGAIGSGVYALSEKGRARFDQFPDLISDDGYVRCLFKEQERTMTKGDYAFIKAPKDLISLIKIKTRSRLGRYQLQDKFPHILANEEKNHLSTFGNLLCNFKLWPKLLTYFFINVVTRIRARYQYLTNQIKWERDESSRS